MVFSTESVFTKASTRTDIVLHDALGAVDLALDIMEPVVRHLDRICRTSKEKTMNPMGGNLT